MTGPAVATVAGIMSQKNAAKIVSTDCKYEELLFDHTYNQLQTVTLHNCTWT